MKLVCISEMDKSMLYRHYRISIIFRSFTVKNKITQLHYNLKGKLVFSAFLYCHAISIIIKLHKITELQQRIFLILIYIHTRIFMLEYKEVIIICVEIITRLQRRTKNFRYKTNYGQFIV